MEQKSQKERRKKKENEKKRKKTNEIKNIIKYTINFSIIGIFPKF